MSYHWDITDRLGFTIGYWPEEFIGIDLNVGESKLTGCFQINFQLGALSVTLTYYLGE